KLASIATGSCVERRQGELVKQKPTPPPSRNWQNRVESPTMTLPARLRQSRSASFSQYHTTDTATAPVAPSKLATSASETAPMHIEPEPDTIVVDKSKHGNTGDGFAAAGTSHSHVTVKMDSPRGAFTTHHSPVNFQQTSREQIIKAET